MIPVFGGVATVAAIVVTGWLFVGGARQIHRSYLILRARLGRVVKRRSSKAQGADAGQKDWIYGDRAPREVRTDSAAAPASEESTQATPTPAPGSTVQEEEEDKAAESIAGAADAEGLLDETKRHAELAASAIVKEAEEKASEILAAAEDARQRLFDEKQTHEAEAAAIVKEAEEKASEILAAAEVARARLEQEAARERALAAEERTKLSAFLSEVLTEVQRSGAQGANVLDLSELRELKGRASGRE